LRVVFPEVQGVANPLVVNDDLEDSYARVE